jgi:hypothetical protein
MKKYLLIITTIFLCVLGYTAVDRTIQTNNLEVTKSGSTTKVTVKAPSGLSSNYNLTLPTSAGTSGYLLSSDGSGNLSFTNSLPAIAAPLKVGDVGSEGSGIDISGVTYDSSFKVSDIDGTNFAQTILHRHSTTLEPLIVGARSNSNTSAHTNVSGGQNLFSVYGAGYAGSNYKLFGSMSLGASSAGTISNTSAPGKFTLSVTPNGGTTPQAALTIDQDKSATFGGNASFAGSLLSPTIVTPTMDIVTLDGAGATPSTPSAGYYKTYVKDSTGKLAILDSNGVETTVGSGSGGINYITDFDGNSDVNWHTFDDGASATPVDGTGGATITTTWQASTSSPIRESSSFVLTKAGANYQGEGASYDFTIHPADKGKVLQGSFDYAIASGTYADDDVTVWIYDVTNAALIQPAPYKLKNHSMAAEKFGFEFQTSSSSTSYRLIFHIASGSTSAYSLKFDNINLGPQAKLYGSPIVDIISFTPTGSWVSNTTYTGRYYKEGQRAKGTIRVSTSGAPTAASLTITLPFTIDTTALISTTEDVVLGRGIVRDSAAATYSDVLVRYNSTTSVALDSGGITTHAGNVYSKEISNINATNPITFGAGDYVEFNFDIPVLGWSSSAIMSSDAATTVVAARLYRSSNQSGVNPNNSAVKVTFDSNTYDLNGGFTASKWTASTSGYYKINLGINISSTNVLNNAYYAQIYKNGSLYSSGPYTTPSAGAAAGVQAYDIIPMNAGDYIEGYLFGAGNNSVSTLTLNAGGGLTFMTIERSSGHAQIAASETVSVRASRGTTQSITNGSSETTVIFTTEDQDTHGAYDNTTGIFTAPMSGTYQISGSFLFDTASWTSGNLNRIYVFKGSVNQAQTAINCPSTASYYPGTNTITTKIRLLSGETLTIRALHGESASRNIIASSVYNFMDIVRVGNY